MNTTFQAKQKKTGSNQTTINVDRNGRPFGQLWTFSGRGEEHPWHAKTLSGAYVNFYGKKGLDQAKAWISAQ